MVNSRQRASIKMSYSINLLLENMEMTDNLIQSILTNFSLSMLILAFILATLHKLTNKELPIFEILYRWVALLPLGMTSIYAFIMHDYFPTLAASTIGWATSPFQHEVAVANLAIGVIAILSIRKGCGFRWATVIASSIWLWGCALGHARQIIENHDMAIGNAGSWFYIDILIPILLIFYMVKLKDNK